MILSGMICQIRKLKNGVGLQSLLESAYKILGNPVALFNTEGKLIAYTDADTDDTIWNEIVTLGATGDKTHRIFEAEGFIEEMANITKISVLKSKNLKYDRILGKIFNKNNSYVSNLMIVACNKPFAENDAMVFEMVCKLVSKEISKSEVYQDYDLAHQEAIIQKLIDGAHNIKQDIAQVEIIYDSLGAGLYIAVADIQKCIAENTSAVDLRNLLKQTEPKYKYAVYSQYIVIIISTNDESLNVGKDLKELIKVFEQKNMYVGISRKFENLFDLKKHYLEAVKAMNYVLECKCSQRIFPYYAKSLETMDRICELKNGIGIQYFLNMGPEIFGNPLLFHDMELNLLAYTENVEIVDPIWKELITYGTSSDETINLFKTEGFVSTMENTKGGALLVSDKIKYDRI